MQQKDQSSGQVQANFNKQAKEERIIRKFSWKKIWFVLLVTFVLIAALEYFSFQQRQMANEEQDVIYGTSLTRESASPVYYETFKWYLFISLSAGIILVITSIVLGFSGMKKVAKKVFLKGFILTLVTFSLYYLLDYLFPGPPNG